MPKLRGLRIVDGWQQTGHIAALMEALEPNLTHVRTLSLHLVQIEDRVLSCFLSRMPGLRVCTGRGVENLEKVLSSDSSLCPLLEKCRIDAQALGLLIYERRANRRFDRVLPSKECVIRTASIYT